MDIFSGEHGLNLAQHQIFHVAERCIPIHNDVFCFFQFFPHEVQRAPIDSHSMLVMVAICQSPFNYHTLSQSLTFSPGR